MYTAEVVYHFEIDYNFHKMFQVGLGVTAKQNLWYIGTYIQDKKEGAEVYHEGKSSVHRRREQERTEGRKELQNTQKIQNGNSKSLSINNYFKCKQIKCSNQKI